MSKSDGVSQSTNSVGVSKYIDGINEEAFDLFLKDLRSGDFKQGRSTLEFEGKFCCLGVACIRPAAMGVVERKVRYTDSVYYGDTSVDLPREVADYLGIPQINRLSHDDSTDIAFFKMGYSSEREEDRKWTAIGLNDTLGKTFNDIADAFENEFLKETV